MFFKALNVFIWCLKLYSIYMSHKPYMIYMFFKDIGSRTNMLFKNIYIV